MSGLFGLVIFITVLLQHLAAMHITTGHGVDDDWIELMQVRAVPLRRQLEVLASDVVKRANQTMKLAESNSNQGVRSVEPSSPSSQVMSFTSACKCFCLQGKREYISPYLTVIHHSAYGSQYADSVLHEGTCIDLGFPAYGMQEGCYTRLQLWLKEGDVSVLTSMGNDGEGGDYAEGTYAFVNLSNGDLDWAAGRLFEQTHTEREIAETKALYDPCNNSYPWDLSNPNRGLHGLLFNATVEDMGTLVPPEYRLRQD